MRILLGTYDVCGWLSSLGDAFQDLGHVVTKAVSQKDPLLEHSYDYTLVDLAGGRPLKLDESPRGRISQAVEWIDYRIRKRMYHRNIERLIREHDLVIKMWHPFLSNAAEDAMVKSNGKQLVRIFVGADARYLPAFRQEFDVRHWSFPVEQDGDIQYHLSNIRTAELHADVIYSVPDQAGLQLRPYMHIHAPMDVGKFKYRIPGRQVPRIIHAPSIPSAKGSDIIESAIETLRGEGIAFEFLSIRNMPNKELVENLSEADILVDQVIYHGPAALSMEAMLSGCAVATRYLDDSPACFRPPVWSIHADNIIPRLRQLITDPQLVRQLAEEGRAYALKHNDARHIASGILRDLESPREPDYHPRFLRDRYEPFRESERDAINQWTARVQGCEWYRNEIEPGTRSGLVF